MLVWVPGHCGIIGNERTDRLARNASALQDIIPQHRELKSCIENGKSTLLRQWQRQWENSNIPNKIKHNIEHWDTATRPNRREEVTLTRLRTHATRHTHLNAYITRTFPPQCNTCQQRLTMSHIFLSCRRYTQERRHLHTLATTLAIHFNTQELLQDNQDRIRGVLNFLRSIQLLNQL